MTAIDQSGLYELKERLLESPNVECLEYGIKLLEQYCAQAYDCELHKSGEGAFMLRQLLELAMSCQYDGAEESMWRPMTEFAAEHCETVGQLLEKASENEDIAEVSAQVDQFRRHSVDSWGEYLELLKEYAEDSSDAWYQRYSQTEVVDVELPVEAEVDEPVEDDEAIETVSTTQIDQLLAVLNQSNAQEESPVSSIVTQDETDCETPQQKTVLFDEQQEALPNEGAAQYEADDAIEECDLQLTAQVEANNESCDAESSCSETLILDHDSENPWDAKSEQSENTNTEQHDAHVDAFADFVLQNDNTESVQEEVEISPEIVGDDCELESLQEDSFTTNLDENSNEQEAVADEACCDAEPCDGACTAECDPESQADCDTNCDTQSEEDWNENNAWDQADDCVADDFNSDAQFESTEEELESDSENKPSVSDLLNGLLNSSSDEETTEEESHLVKENTVEIEDTVQQEDSADESESEAFQPAADSEEDWLPAEQLETVASDIEIRDAYLEDAVRCLDQMEKCSLEFEEKRDKEAAVTLFCRELHTLKGASASVGLTNLASVIHDKETTLQNTNDLSDDELTDLLLDSVDKMRNVIERIQSGNQEPEPETAPEEVVESPQSNEEATKSTYRPARPSLSVSSTAASSSEDALIRIRTSKLDRLMDMLAELVVLRNRRESSLIAFNDCNKELTRCAARLSVCQNTRLIRDEDDEQYANALGGQLQEIARDVSVVAGNIRDLQKPVGSDNTSISHFIRDFRQELMQLRRVPTEGLFNRLQRAARDVAKLEDKKLKLNCIGGETGIEQELQEKLYEPLMHIVRNAVSHGIESPEERAKNGKVEQGTLTLKAQTNSQILVIEISDNGKGLDYDAIRKRGLERGLIKSSDRIANEELAHLIFHPGFSTRDQATQVSGRGVGMDIVSTTMEQMRGRIDIESTANVGTTMRMIVPLRSAIEHVMVFKASDQLFALPTQAVVSANRLSEFQREDLIVHGFSQMLSMPATDCQDVVLLRTTAQGSGAVESVGLRVQEIIGPEEVVMRNLPGLIGDHPLFSGLTLSGSGETVLMLDSEKMADYATQFESVTQENNTVQPTQSSARKVVLVVDDSLSARKMLVRKLTALGIDTQEAGDGVEALDVLRQNKFDLVLTDLDMPRLGGMELLFDLQKRDRYDTPVVVVTSRSQEQFRQQAVDRGAADYLVKPVTDDALNKVLSKLNIISN